MPALLTHDFFGRDVVDCAVSSLGASTADELDAFLLGNQGPDPLFYLVVDPFKAKWAEVGNLMHEHRPAQLLYAMRAASERLQGKEQKIARAYVAGFACHWQLDSAMHPFVYFWQHGITGAGVFGLDERDGQKVHAEVERDLDEMVLYAKTGQTIATYRPLAHTLVASRETLATIDKLYFYAALWVFGRASDPKIFSAGVFDYRLVFRLLESRSGLKRALLGRIERLATGSSYSLAAALDHTPRAEDTSDFDNRDHGPWENPFTHEISFASFWDIFEAAAAKVPHTLEVLLSGDLDLEAAVELTGNVNFEGGTSAPDAPFEW